jgi:hypothetical protein
MLMSFAAAAQVNVLTYHNDNARTGQNLNEVFLTPATVNSTTFGKLFTYSVDGYVYAQPLYVSGLNITGKGVHNVIFVATQHNSIYAFDADSNAGAGGGLLWRVSTGPSAVTPNSDFGNRYGPYSDIFPEVNVTSTPVIDLASGIIYVDAFIHTNGSYFHKLHALNIADGSERSFSPVLITASVPGQGRDSSNGIVTFNASQELQRPALTLAGGKLFVAFSSYGDTDPYHGWVIGFNASTLQQLTNYVFNTTPNSTTGVDGPNAAEAGIWMSGNGLVVDANTNLYFMTGNGSFDATNGVSGTEYGDSFVKLSTTNKLAVADFFTPHNQDQLAAADADLGSGGVLLLPDSVGSVAHPHLLVGCGKEGKIYLVDRDDMGHYNAANDNQIVQSLGAVGGTWSSPAYFNNRIYYLGQSDSMKAFRFSNGLLINTPDSQTSSGFGFPGATPSISANGTNAAIAWALQTDGFDNPSPAVLHAYNAYDLSQELYNSDQAGSRDQPGNAVKFAVPTIANGKVYVGGQFAVSVFGLFQPPLVPVPGIYQGLFYDTNGAALLSSGFFSATVAKAGSFSAQIQLGASKYSFSGKFSPLGIFSNSIPRKKLPPLSIQLVSSTNDVILGQLSSTNWTADLRANRGIYSKTNLAPQAGKYTLVIPGSAGSATQPGGDGFGTVTVDSTGHVMFSGTAGDGTKLSQKALLSGQGQWPFYLSLYSGNGMLLGWLNFTNQLTNDISGLVDWIKSPQPTAKIYPAGFTNQTAVLGSTYGFTNGIRILNLTTGQVSLANGNLPQNITNPFVLGANNKITLTNKSSLSFTTSSGLFKGKILNPPGKAIAISGVVLQKQNTGSGFFLGTNQSGRVFIEPAP